MISRTVLPFDPSPHDLEFVARRRLKQVSLALGRIEIDYEQANDRLVRLAARATRLRAERQALRDVLDRRGARR